MPSVEGVETFLIGRISPMNWYEYSVNNMWSNTNLFYKVSTTIPGGLRISSNSSETLQLVLLAWSGGPVWTIPWRQGMQTPKKETKNQGLRVVFGSEIDYRNFDQYKITDWHCLLAMPTNEDMLRCFMNRFSNMLVIKLWYCKIERWSTSTWGLGIDKQGTS